MEQMTTRTCPACGSADYTFRSRKKIVPKDGEEGPEATEVKYRCKKCEHEWRVRVPTGRSVTAPEP